MFRKIFNKLRKKENQIIQKEINTSEISDNFFDFGNSNDLNNFIKSFDEKYNLRYDNLIYLPPTRSFLYSFYITLPISIDNVIEYLDIKFIINKSILNQGFPSYLPIPNNGFFDIKITSCKYKNNNVLLNNCFLYNIFIQKKENLKEFTKIITDNLIQNMEDNILTIKKINKNNHIIEKFFLLADEHLLDLFVNVSDLLDSVSLYNTNFSNSFIVDEFNFDQTQLNSWRIENNINSVKLLLHTNNKEFKNKVCIDNNYCDILGELRISLKSLNKLFNYNIDVTISISSIIEINIIPKLL